MLSIIIMILFEISEAIVICEHAHNLLMTNLNYGLQYELSCFDMNGAIVNMHTIYLWRIWTILYSMSCSALIWMELLWTCTPSTYDEFELYFTVWVVLLWYEWSYCEHAHHLLMTNLNYSLQYELSCFDINRVIVNMHTIYSSIIWTIGYSMSCLVWSE